jgi:hypothetical protein
MSRFAQTIFKVDFEKFVQDHYNRIKQEKLDLNESNITDDRSVTKSLISSRQRSNASSMKSSFSAKSNIEEIEMAVNETEGFNVDDMHWMAVRDMLIFERFEDFYIDLI